MDAIKIKEKFITEDARRYDNDPEFQLPEPKPLMSAKSYHEKDAVPLVQTLKKVIRSILLQFFEKTRELTTALNRANTQVRNLSSEIERYREDNEWLRGVEKDYGRLRRGLGDNKADEIIGSVKAQEAARKKLSKKRNRDYVR